MRISDKFGKDKVVFSFEVFPPKRTGNISTIFNTLDSLKGLNPDYISVTYGAAGVQDKYDSAEIAGYIKEKHEAVEAVAHITCINSTKKEILTTLERFKNKGIENILALRGDRSPGVEPKNDFKYASELIEFIRKNDDSFGISGACYPECHGEAENDVQDILNLKKKVEAGAQTLVSQLFFDNSVFYRFKERCDIAGINVPIQAGIMPVTNKNQIERMVSLCGASLPVKFSRMMQKYSENPLAMRDAGIAYATDQIVDLIANGVEGIHLYTMNNPYIASKIWDNVKGLL